MDSHNEEINQVVISPRWSHSKHSTLEKKPILKQETAPLDNFVDRVSPKTWNRTQPVHHQESLSAEFSRIREIRERMSATKSIQEHR